jgi:Na+/H+ antiporter NhaC
MIRVLIFLLFFLQISTFFANDIIELSFPKYVVSGSKFKVQYTSNQALDSINFNGKWIKTQSDAESHFFETTIVAVSDIQLDEDFKVINDPVIIPAWLSILPPLFAIFLALIFKEVLTSLFIGIFVGVATIGLYVDGITGVFVAFLTVLDTYILKALANTEHLSIILFSLVIGGIVAIISRNGGMQGVVNRIVKIANNRKSGMISTYLLGIAIFFDDYANTLVVGNTMRPITDKLRISREKLAYIVDSTAAPIAAIAFVTTWIGAELGYISSGVEKINNEMGGNIQEGAYSIFINSLGYSFYPIFTLVFMFFLIWKNKDFGPMYKAEKNAIKNGVETKNDDSTESSQLDEFNPVKGIKIKAYNAIIPILVVVFGTIFGLVYTGISAWKIKLSELGISTSNGVWASLENYPENTPITFFQKVGAVIGEANSYEALLWSSLIALFVAILLTFSQRIMKVPQIMDTFLMGVKTMIPAIAILTLAWSLAEITADLDTANFIKGLFGNNFQHVWIVPAITFVLSAVIAFSTGSSWSTMALVYPIMIPTAFAVCVDSGMDPSLILYNTVASVLAGAVLGDHCSPISDTTILSSLATSCNHISHVRTQMPYALTVGGVALLFGIIPGALGVSSLITLPIGILVLYLIVKYVGKPNDV